MVTGGAPIPMLTVVGTSFTGGNIFFANNKLELAGRG